MAENPEREMLRLCSVRCPHMNLITLEDTLKSLQNRQFQIELPDEIIKRARNSLDRMLEIS
jgi:quinolinate synthase